MLEANADDVVFSADATVSTQLGAALLGVSRTTDVRLVDRGELTAEGGPERLTKTTYADERMSFDARSTAHLTAYRIVWPPPMG
ncbi:MAG: hypothetical protein DLM58_12460 [Pseudonocardiales bacterium]|nr:MAG: hypothetical protein DLM58_12460 [Pseudonocardiales bacterium]